MRIGITGATGLIGRHIAALAAARGHEVIPFTRHPENGPPGSRLFSLDSPPDLTGCDAILNLAGESVIGLWTPAKRRAIKQSRILATRRIVEAIRVSKSPPAVLVSGSAIGIYGNTYERPTDENGPLGAGFLAEVCEAWESEALAARQSGTRVVLLRTGVVLSRSGGALAAMLPIFRLGLGGKIGNGNQWIAWIHIDDEAALALAALENAGIHGPLNATAPNPVRNVVFTRTLASLLHRPAIFRVPALALKAATGGFSAELLESRRILPTAATRASIPFLYPDLRPALADVLRMA